MLNRVLVRPRLDREDACSFANAHMA
jgi:hypothetical protein